MISKLKAELKKVLSLMSTESELKVSEMVIGGKVELIDSEGNLEVAPDGEYQIGEDTIVVKDGLIESINGDKGEAKEEEEMEEDTPADEVDEKEAMKAELDAMKEAIAQLKTELEALKTSLDESNATEQNMASKFNTQLETLNETIKLLMSTPAEPSRTNESIRVKDSYDAKMLEAAKLFSKFK